MKTLSVRLQYALYTKTVTVSWSAAATAVCVLAGLVTGLSENRQSFGRRALSAVGLQKRDSRDGPDFTRFANFHLPGLRVILIYMRIIIKCT